MQTWSISSPFVTAEIQSLGGMCAPASFRLGDATVSPLAVGPWADEPQTAELPGILRRLRGEWPCVPFGIAWPQEMPEGWSPPAGGEEPDPEPHGFSSNNDWRLVTHSPDSISLAIDYPAGHPIRGLRRTVRASAVRPRLEFELMIDVRRDCRLPIGIHPTFALPGPAGSNRLVLDPGVDGWTPPAPVEPGLSRMAVNRHGVSPASVPQMQGEPVDVTRLPLDRPSEELFLATRANGRVRLECTSAGYAATLTWDPKVYASCMLWISNCGRAYSPWNSRNMMLGIEPVTSAFDLGTAISANPYNPLERAGVPTARRFKAGEVLTTSYAIEVEALARPA